MNVIDEYLSNLESPQRGELERIRRLVKQLVPDTEDTIGYGIPTIKYKGKNLLHFAAYKDHLSLYPGSAPVQEFVDELTEFTISKGTIQFTPEKPLSDELLNKIIVRCCNRIDGK